MAPTLAPADDSSQNDEPPSQRAFHAFLNFGVANQTFDVGQFDHDLRTLELPAFPFPLGLVAGVGLEFGLPRHLARFGFSTTTSYLADHDNGRFASFAFYQYDLFGGYRVVLADRLSLHADVGLGVAQWEYIAIGKGLGGRAEGMLFTVRPELGLLVRLGDITNIRIFGNYVQELCRGYELYSGDLHRRSWDDRDWSHFGYGLDLTLLFF
jgi:hypothetical protein